MFALSNKILLIRVSIPHHFKSIFVGNNCKYILTLINYFLFSIKFMIYLNIILKIENINNLKQKKNN